MCFFFSSRRRHTRWPRDWSSDVCSSDLSALAFGPGLVSGTAVPGAPGVAVVTGHRDTHFRFLQHLKSGDEIVVETRGGQIGRASCRERVEGAVGAGWLEKKKVGGSGRWS